MFLRNVGKCMASSVCGERKIRVGKLFASEGAHSVKRTAVRGVIQCTDIVRTRVGAYDRLFNFMLEFLTRDCFPTLQ